MKKAFLNSSIDLIKKNKHYTEERLEIIAYGLEGIYLTFTKMIILFSLSYVLGIVNEFLLLLISYNVIRSQAFGIHATKSIYCLISSCILFIGGSLICKYVTLPFWFLLVSSILCVICLILYAPADTKKRPIINKRKRMRFKYLSIILGIIYTAFIILFRDYNIVKYLSLGMIEAVLMILPISYKIFQLPYNNYINYYSDV